MKAAIHNQHLKEIDMFTRPTLIRIIFGFAVTTGVAFTAVNAADNEIILHDSIHDYADNASGSYSDSATQYSDYVVKIVLDESYHDYVSSDVKAFESSKGSHERAEFAAFEGSTSTDLPWELKVLD